MKQAIFLHLYYHHLWQEISGRLKAAPFSYRLYVNLVIDHTDHLKFEILRDFPDAVVNISVNRGMDCGGQLRTLDYWIKNGRNEEILVFLHSKGKPVDMEDQKKVRETDELRALLWSIITPEVYPRVEEAFKDQEVGMVGVREWHRYPGVAHGDPIPECKKYCDLLGLDNYDTNRFGFIGGTCFFVRSEIYRRTFENINILDIVNELPAASTGGDIHALERIFGYIVLSENFKIKGV